MKERRCRPGLRCFDGCNWIRCDDAGTSLGSTALECEVRIDDSVDFPRGSADLGHAQADWNPLVTAARKATTPTRRKLLVTGYTDPSEARTVVARDALARRRARAVAQRLIEQGVPQDQVKVQVAESPASGGQRVGAVRLLLDPKHPVREDFEPSSDHYRDFCGAR